MRLSLGSLDLEVRVQERKVTFVDVFHKGKMIASNLAIHNPLDQFNSKEGEDIAIGRVAPDVAAYYGKNNDLTRIMGVRASLSVLLRAQDMFIKAVTDKLVARKVRKAKADTKAAEKLVFERVSQGTQHLREFLDKFYAGFPPVPKGPFMLGARPTPSGSPTGRFSFSQPWPWNNPRPR